MALEVLDRFLILFKVIITQLNASVWFKVVALLNLKDTLTTGQLDSVHAQDEESPTSTRSFHLNNVSSHLRPTSRIIGRRRLHQV